MKIKLCCRIDRSFATRAACRQRLLHVGEDVTRQARWRRNTWKRGLCRWLSRQRPEMQLQAS